MTAPTTTASTNGPVLGRNGMAALPSWEQLVELITAGKAKDYPKARQIHDRLLPVTKAVYHRGSHMEGTVALKLGLVAHGVLKDATVRSPLRPLTPAAAEEITRPDHPRRRRREAVSRSTVTGAHHGHCLARRPQRHDRHRHLPSPRTAPHR